MPGQDNLIYLPPRRVKLKRGRAKKPLWSWENLILFVFFILLSYFSFLLAKNFMVYRNLARERARLMRSLEVQQKELKQLEENKAALNRDDYLEEQARRRLGLVKKDEIVYKIVRTNAPQHE